ncbi:hypothetical protein QF025_006826 [Paraburkholderia graminis]|uniref:Transposase IS66 central domain-containing protein n=1 Tax=Paraburkholderia graminis TaxID=60548 RepID=A0ABD5CTK6_9BURK|nr:hypothetical protein [Paraburkholderia graminis]
MDASIIFRFDDGWEALIPLAMPAWRTLEGPTPFGCLTHARRAFVDALKGMKKPGGRAAQALVYFKPLYQVETLAKDDLPEGETRDAYAYRLRQQHSAPGSTA